MPDASNLWRPIGWDMSSLLLAGLRARATWRRSAPGWPSKCGSRPCATPRASRAICYLCCEKHGRRDWRDRAADDRERAGMNWIFLDGIPWDYDIETPLVRPLGGSQSCLCYLA